MPNDAGRLDRLENEVGRLTAQSNALVVMVSLLARELVTATGDEDGVIARLTDCVARVQSTGRPPAGMSGEEWTVMQAETKAALAATLRNVSNAILVG